MTDHESDHEMDDEQMDAMVRRLAADYNAPPATPRDAMWEAIRAARAPRLTSEVAGDVAGDVAAPPPVVALETRRRSPAARWWPLAVAATLLLAAGIEIGRRLPGHATTVASTTPSAAPSITTQDPTQNTVPASSSAEPTTLASNTALSPRAATGASPRTHDATGSAAGASRVRPNAMLLPDEERMARAMTEGAATDGSSAYRVVTSQHLERAEALLTAYRAEAQQGKVDAQLAGWARDLLSTTRLLLDSPAASDVRHRRVLEDLELVLVQIVQLDPNAPADERDLVDRAIRQRDVMSRLRSTIPAGAAASGS